MKSFTLVLGGARSGKSTHAEQLAGQGEARVLYVATAEARDEEMRSRIETHRKDRPESWSTLEAPLRIGEEVSSIENRYDSVLLECFTMLTSNVFEATGDDGDVESRVQEEIDAIFRVFDARSENWVVVSNEIGLGIVPETSLGRKFRDVLGRAHQTIAQRADNVVLVVAGIPMRVK